MDLWSWPEIKSISSGEVTEIKEENNNENSETVGGIEKREFDNYTVEEVINILSTFPKDYEFLCCGESDYAIWVDHTSGMVSIDRADWINNQIENLKRFTPE